MRGETVFGQLTMGEQAMMMVTASPPMIQGTYISGGGPTALPV